ncbi:MAG: endonuclease/exonuclease/phosphatase family protein [Flavobacteriaceae bacterium]
MKRLSAFNRFMFLINVLVILLLLLACIAPHISDERFSILVFLGLGVPALVLANIFFLTYWVIKRRVGRASGSFCMLVLGFFVLGPFIRPSFTAVEIQDDDLTVMSYNVRVFNRYEELESKTVFEDIKTFVYQEDPDIICFQEPSARRIKEYENYPHKYLEYIHMQGKGVLGILSKYPIVNSGLVNFPHTMSSASFADIRYQNDTIRVYNVHLESLGITPGQGAIRGQSSDKLFKMLHKAFQKQLEQAKILREHRASVSYGTILCGDFNNVQFSNIYNIAKGDLQDSFIEAGSGYGRTLIFHGIPFRIDFIMADQNFEVKSHKTYDVIYSDHFPTMASFQLRTD